MAAHRRARGVAAARRKARGVAASHRAVRGGMVRAIQTGPRARSATWIAGGALAVVGGALTAFLSLSAATTIGPAASAPACVVEFDEACTTERAGQLERQSTAPRAFWAQEWRILVPGVQPFRDVRREVQVPRQDGESTLSVGDPVILIYFGRAPAWVRSATGAVLETDEHPRRRALFRGWVALMLLGGGVLGIRTGFASVPAWRDRATMDTPNGPEVVLLLAGFGALVGGQVTGWIVTAQLACAVIGAIFGVVTWRRSRSRVRAEAGA